MASMSESSPRKIGGEPCFGEVEIGKIGSTIKGARLEELRHEFHIPAAFGLRIPLKDEQVNSVQNGEICVFEEYLKAGLRFPIHPFIEEVFEAFGLLPCRLTPNSFRHLIGFLVVCREKKIQPSLNLFRAAFSVNNVFGDKWFLYFMPRNGCKLLSHMPPNIKNWKDKYFFVSSDSGWGFSTQWTNQFNKITNSVIPLSGEEEGAFEVLAQCVLDARKIFADKYLRQAGISGGHSDSTSEARKLEKLVQVRQTQRKRRVGMETKVNLAAAKRNGCKKIAGPQKALASDGFSEQLLAQVIHIAPDSPFDMEPETDEPMLEAAEVLVSSPFSIQEIKGTHEAAQSSGSEPRAESETHPSSEETTHRVDDCPVISANGAGTTTRSMASDGLDSLPFIPFTGLSDTDTIWVDRTGGAPAVFKAKLDKSLLKTFEEMMENVGSKRFQVVDSRPEGRFRGTELDQGLESGHIPGAVNIPFQSFLTETGHEKSVEEIQQMFREKKVDLSKPLTITCRKGVTACHIALAAYLCGKPDVSIYDGSWSEWFHRAPPEYKVSEMKRNKA